MNNDPNEGGDSVCDVCGYYMAEHTHKDENNDNLCDLCGKKMSSSGSGSTATKTCSWCSRNKAIQSGDYPVIIKFLSRIIHFFIHTFEGI